MRITRFQGGWGFLNDLSKKKSQNSSKNTDLFRKNKKNFDFRFDSCKLDGGFSMHRKLPEWKNKNNMCLKVRGNS